MFTITLTKEEIILIKDALVDAWYIAKDSMDDERKDAITTFETKLNESVKGGNFL